MKLAFPKPKRLKGRGCRLSDRDLDEQTKRGYTNPGSFVRKDGSEVLKGADWTRRKEELRERSSGRCEYILLGLPEPTRCREPATDAHHKITRGTRRDDRIQNLLHVCWAHHKLLDRRVPWPDKRNV